MQKLSVAQAKEIDQEDLLAATVSCDSQSDQFVKE